MISGKKRENNERSSENHKRYDVERLEEFLMDAIELSEMQEQDEPEIIFVDDDPLII